MFFKPSLSDLVTSSSDNSHLEENSISAKTSDLMVKEINSAVRRKICSVLNVDLDYHIWPEKTLDSAMCFFFDLTEKQ